MNFDSPAPKYLSTVEWSPDPTRPGCTMSSLAFIRQEPLLSHYAPLLDTLDINWDKYGVDIRSGYMRPNCYFGIPWWHADYNRPNAKLGGPMFYYVKTAPRVAPLMYYTGQVEMGRRWGDLDQERYDADAKELDEGVWAQFHPLVLHRASESRSSGARLFVRVRPMTTYRNVVEHSCMVYADIAKAKRDGTW